MSPQTLLSQALLAASADVEEHTPEGCTALTLAAENGHAAIIHALATAQADVDRTSGTEPYIFTGSTLQPPLTWAAFGMHLGAVEALLALRANVDARDSHGFTALHYAACMGADDVVRAVLASLAAVDAATTKTASTGTPAGYTPLMMAATISHPTVATLLLEARASVYARTAFPMLTSLHFTCSALHGAPCVAVLATARADLEARLKTDVTPLMWAAVLNNAEVAQALLDAKADASARTEKKAFGPGNAPCPYCRSVPAG